MTKEGGMKEKIAEIIRQAVCRLKHRGYDEPIITSEDCLEETDKILALFEAREKQFQTLLQDTADDDDVIRELALKVIPKNIVEGDSFGVPPITTLVEWIVDKWNDLPSLDEIVVEEECQVEHMETSRNDFVRFVCAKCHGTGTFKKQIDSFEELISAIKKGRNICYQKQ